jgi:hypothetical protein
MTRCRISIRAHLYCDRPRVGWPGLSGKAWEVYDACRAARLLGQLAQRVY